MRLPSFVTAALLAISLLGASAETPKVGDLAPVIEGKDQDGRAWKVPGETGKEVVILYFYPKDDTPGCTKEACGLRDRLDELKKQGVSVFGVSRDDAGSHKAFHAKHSLNFPLLVDTDGKITDAYGAGVSDKPRSRRVSFLIGRDGRILHVTDSRDAQVHLDELREAVAKIKN